MSTDRARDELAAIIERCRGNSWLIADAIIAAGWLSPAGVRAAQAEALREAARVWVGLGGSPDAIPERFLLERANAEQGRQQELRMEPGRWWRAVGSDCEVWCETSSEAEVREMARPGDRIQQIYAATATEWRDEPNPYADALAPTAEPFDNGPQWEGDEGTSFGLAAPTAEPEPKFRESGAGGGYIEDLRPDPTAEPERGHCSECGEYVGEHGRNCPASTAEEAKPEPRVTSAMWEDR